MMQISSEKKLLNYYDQLYSQYGATISSMGWSECGQTRRFCEVLHCLPQDIHSLLDVGCGLGHLELFLRKRMPDLLYTGWDINKIFLSHCISRERADFSRRNILDSPPPSDSFEAIVSIGALNTNFGDNENTIKLMIAHMYSACSRICILSATSIYADLEHKTDNMYFYDPVELFTFSRTLTRYTDLRHGYMPHDFMLVLYKHH